MGLGKNWMFINYGRPSVRTLFLAAIPILAAITAVVFPSSAEDLQIPVAVRANQLARAGHPDEAVRLLLDVLDAHPADLETRLALAEIYAKNMQSDRAEAEFRKALRQHPASPAAEIALGRFYAGVGSWDAAEQVLDDAVHLHPQQSDLREQLALVLAREHKYKQAADNIRLVPPPANPTARIQYFRLAASIHSGLGDSHGAADFIEKALQVTPHDEQLQLLAAVTEAEAGEWKACLKNIAPLYNTHPGAESGLLLLRAQLATHGDFETTIRSLRALNLPEDQKFEVRIRSAETLAAAEKHLEAAEDFAEALRIKDGGDDALLYSLAVEQYDAGQFDKAFATLDSLRAQNTSAEIEDLAGDIEEQRGDFSAAVDSHEKAVVLAPQEERYRLSLGAELLENQAYASAVSVFQQASELFPNSARSFVGLGMAYYFLEKYDESVSAFLRADKLDGESGRAIGYLGATQLESPTGPTPAAVQAVCAHADSNRAKSLTWCGVLLFRKAYLEGNQAAALDLIPQLRAAAKLAPNNSVAICSLGRAFEWTEQLTDARHWLEICVRMRPNSAEDHYRLSRVYRGLGLTKEAAEQADLTDKSNAANDQRQDIAKKFAQETFGQSISSTKLQGGRP